MENKFKELFKTLKLQMNNPDGLSKIAIELSAILFYSNELQARAELEEKEKMVEMFDTLGEDGKKMSSAEAEKRAVVLTCNSYGKIKVQNEAVIEVIQSIKARLKVLENEKQVQRQTE